MRRHRVALALGLAACGSSSTTPGGDGAVAPGEDGGGVPPPIADAGPPPTEDELSTAAGCTGVYNPDQVLTFRLVMSDADWTALKADTTNAVMFPATFSCDGEAPLAYPVGVRRKRSGSPDKPGLKVDFNELTPGGEWRSLKKLSLENGISEGSDTAEMGDVIAEWMAWRVMVLSRAHASRAAFARVEVNGAFVGTYVNVEQVDKRFLRSRLGDDAGWLYKLSGSNDDGYKTNETQPNPWAADMCFWDKNPCAPPSAAELATYLPEHLDVDQMLRLGFVNALLANSDAPLVKDNNFYWYDWSGPRVYFPWDLDTTQKDAPAIFGGPGSTLYTDVLFTHWEDDYDALGTALLDGPLALAALEAELDRAVTVAGPALEEDPTIAGETPAGAVEDLRAWWIARHAQLAAELAAHAP